MEFLCRLIAPEGVIFEGPVEQVTATNQEGEFGVLAQHVDFITSLVPCALTLKLPDGELRCYAIREGLAEVKDGRMTVLVPEAISPEEIDEEQVRRELDELRRRLASLEFATDPYIATANAIATAEAKLRTAQLSKR